MKFYVFASDINLVKKLESAGVDGVLHTYNAHQSNAFIAIPKHFPETKIKHMIAIRPYTISPQLLSQIVMTFDQLYGKGIIQINLISGWIKENEKDFGGIVGPINDNSLTTDRSNYLIEYVDVIESLENKNLDYYVSVTNSFTFDAASKHNSKIIIDYNHFKENRYDLHDEKVMVMISPTDNDGIPISHEELFLGMKALSLAGVEEVIFPGGNENVMNSTINFIKKYNTLPELTVVK
jgi:hypothetical protein